MTTKTIELRKSLSAQLRYILGTNEGLICLIILFEFAAILFLFSFSQPVQSLLGRPLIPVQLDADNRVGRIIMLYHALAIPFICALAFFTLTFYEIRPNYLNQIKLTLIPGSMITTVSALAFAYIRRSMLIHGFYIFGLSLVFFGGVLLVIAIFPTKTFPAPERNQEAPYLWGINLEYLNIWLTAIFLLISSAIGAAAGAYFGTEFEAKLAEDIVRQEHNVLERLVISHLHIMVALASAVILLLVFRYVKMKGFWYRLTMLPMVSRLPIACRIRPVIPK